MLHNSSIQSDSRLFMNGAFPRQAERESGGVGQVIDFALGLLRRQYWVIVLATILALAVSAIYLKITPPTYTGQVKVLFGNPKAQFVQQQSLIPEAPIDLTQIETQLQILRSKTIATLVINQLNLADDPDFAGSHRTIGPLKRFLGWLTGKPADQPVESQDDTLVAMIAEFEYRLSAARVGYSNVIEINFISSNADRAAKIANAIADNYINDQMNSKFEANRVAATWLQNRLQQLGEQASTAERAVNTFKTQNNIVATGGKLVDDQQITELSSRLVAARAQTSEAFARLNRLETILSSNSNDSTSIGNLDATSSEALSNPIINSLRQQYLEYARRESDWSARFGRDHLAVVNLRTRMRDIRTSILDEVHRLAETSRSDFEVSKQRQEEMEKQLTQSVSQSRTTNSAEIAGRELETSAKGYRTLYESFLQRYMGSVQQESFPISEARVISPAAPPQGKTKPKTNLILTVAMMAGIVIGAALGALRELIERVFRTSAQIEDILQLPCLSLVPLLKKTEPAPSLTDRSPLAESQSCRRILSRSNGTYWAAATTPLSRFAESIRSIKLAIDLNPTKTSNKVVGMTSSLPNEGKSTIAASLAQLIGHGGKRVILVDCDLRNPSLSANLAPEACVGIVEVLSGACTLEEAIWKDPKTNLDLLPVAHREKPFHTSEILSAAQTRKLFDRLRANYDYVIVDLPPLSPVVDVRATTPLVDGFILVVEWGRTKIDVVQHALHNASNVHELIIGTVLNKTNMKEMKSYNSYHSDYYSNEHYTRYGFSEE